MQGDQDGEDNLICSVREGRLEKVRELINRFGLSYSQEWEQGYVLLRDALSKGHTAVAELLLYSGCEVNSKNKSTVFTPLHYAALFGYIEIMTMIIEKGGNINAKNYLGTTPLNCAIQNKNIEVTELLLKYGADVNARANDGNSPLHFASATGCIQTAELLLKHGASLSYVCNSGYYKGYTPLLVAVETGNKTMMEFLISRGAIVDFRGENDITSIHIAAKKGYTSISEYLLNYGICVNSSTFRGYTPLHFACQVGHEETVKLFVKRGADINISTKYNNTIPLDIALNKGHKTIVKLLLQNGARVDKLDNDGKTSLHLAAQNGQITFVELLLEHSAKVDNLDNNGKTALHLAVENGHLAVTELLLQYGAKIDNVDNGGKTVLHLAVENGNLTIVEHILKYGPDLNNQSNKRSVVVAIQNYGADYKKILDALLEYGLKVLDYDAKNPKLLHAAVEKGYLNVVEYLLRFYADINIIDNTTYEGFAPSHSATENIPKKRAKSLISYEGYIYGQNKTGRTPAHDADINATDKNGKTALHFTAYCEESLCKFLTNGDQGADIKNVKAEIAKLLLNKGANVDAQTNESLTTLHIAVQKKYEKVAEVLLAHKANANISAEKGITPLHLSAQNGNEEITKILLKKGANVNAKQENGHTALHIATQNGHLTVVQLLLQHEANVNNLVNDGKTALHFAARNGYLTVVELLLQYGAKVDNLDNNGKTALYLAVENGYLAIVKQILKYFPDLNNQNNKSSVRVAIQNYGANYTEILEALLEYGLKVNTYDAKNPKLLHDAVERGYLQIVEDLIKFYADVRTIDSPRYDSMTLLHSVTKNSQEEKSKVRSYEGGINVQDKIRITHDTDINTKDINGRTALHFTAFGEHRGTIIEDNKAEIAKLLVSKGANVDAQTKEGLTTLHIAIENERKKVVEVLLEHKANVNIPAESGITPLHFSVQKGNVELTKILLNQGANVNAKQRDGTTALHVATLKGYASSVKALLEYGANVNFKTKHEITPLHLVSQTGNQKIMEFILSFDPDIDSRDRYGRTALHLASEIRGKKTVATLLDYGSDINITCNSNKTALDYAMANIRCGSQANRRPRNSSHVQTINVLICHIVKMKMANLYVSKENLQSLNNNDDRIDFKDKCIKEIIRMKSEKITDIISFYDVLKKCSSSLARDINNENVEQVLKSENYKTQFPIYASMIKSHFRKAMERNEFNKLLRHSNKVFHFVLNNSPELPYDCTEIILSYLSVKDLRNLIDACKILSIDNNYTQ